MKRLLLLGLLALLAISRADAGIILGGAGTPASCAANFSFNGASANFVFDTGGNEKLSC